MNYIVELSKLFVKKYDKSIRSVGGNSKKRIIIYPSKDIKNYSEYETYQEANNDIQYMHSNGFITATFKENGDCTKITFIETDSNIDYFYQKSGIENKFIKIQNLNKILNKYMHYNEILKSYCLKQIENISLNKSVKFFKNDYTEFENILIGVKAILMQKEEILIRNLSIKIYNDSKILEHLKDKISLLIFEYGNYESKETVFEENNVFKTPTFIYIKGNFSIHFKNKDIIRVNQDINGIGLCSDDLKNIEKIKIIDKTLYTIENLTSYFDFKKNYSTVIYLAGFHNSAKKEFLQKIYNQNNNILYYHFGDIDAGGIYILKHLIKQTNIPFIPYKMDIPTLEKHKYSCKKLTKNDKNRLKKIKESNSHFTEIIDYMIKNNCKLEQEAIDID